MEFPSFISDHGEKIKNLNCQHPRKIQKSTSHVINWRDVRGMHSISIKVISTSRTATQAQSTHIAIVWKREEEKTMHSYDVANIPIKIYIKRANVV
jgi:hypothetical protein